MHLINLKVTFNVTFNVYIYIYTLIKSSTFADLLMEKPGNWFAIPKMWEKRLKKNEIWRKGPASLLRLYCGTVFSFCLCKPGFSISGTSIPNGWNPNNQWVKKINGLLQMVPLTKAWCTVPFKNRKSWNFC